MNICLKFYPNRTMGKWSKIGEGNFEKKMKTYKMPMQFKSMYEVSSKSDNGKGFKNRGKVGEQTDLLTDVEKPRYTRKAKFETS